MDNQLTSDRHEERLNDAPDGRAPLDFERRIVGHTKLLRRSCGTCENYMGNGNGNGECRLYADMPVLEGDLCPQYRRGKGQLLIGGIWLLLWVAVALTLYLVQLL